jgi:predicted 3-demethylubiquinone-9 3-methyltransferase (glyoxalase superfamily)
MQKVVPNLWFDHNALEAANFYISVFADSKINSISYYPKTEEEGLADFQKDFAGKVLSIDFELSGFRFTAINADATFKPNPSISCLYASYSKKEIDELWKKLSENGKTLMELNEYPFSKYYGWVQDKYGFSWQLILNNSTEDKHSKIMPSLLFTQQKDGQAEQAMKFYTSIFKDSEIGKSMASGTEGKISYADFRLFDQWFAVMDGGQGHDFSFNPAISLMVACKDQQEIDYYWEKLSANPEFEQCGWLQDKYGVSWQITPANIEELLKTPGAFKRMMQMKKINIQNLKIN